MKIKCKYLIGLLLALSVSSAYALPIYVGSFNVYDGPVWTSNPQVMSALDVAAMLFGGSPSDYSISVVNNVNNITHTAWLDGYGNTQYLVTPAAENFSLSSGADGYGSPPSFSAWVCDHANCAAYGYPQTTPIAGYNYTNYVFTADNNNSVPEPATLVLLTLGLTGLGISRRKSKKV